MCRRLPIGGHRAARSGERLAHGAVGKCFSAEHPNVIVGCARAEPPLRSQATFSHGNAPEGAATTLQYMIRRLTRVKRKEYMSADPTANDSQRPGQELEAVDSEVTPVGGTSKKLLELSEGGDQNTRAYQAPRELIELARRQRALGFRPSQPVEGRPSAAPPVPVQSVRPEPLTSQPAVSSQKAAPAAPKPVISSPRSASQKASSPKVSDSESKEAASSQKRRTRPVSLSPSDFSEGDAAPPRPIAESLGPRDRPTRRPGRSEENVESSGPSISYQPASTRSADSVEAIGEDVASSAALDPDLDSDAAPPVARSRPSRALSSEPSGASPARPPASLSDLARAASDRSAAPSVAAPHPRLPANDLEPPMPSSLSTNVTTLMSRSYFWAIVFVLFIVVGFALARWRVLDLILPRAP
ncbi:MAG: hypothetical protein RL685_4317 [Pseudomonadota bacterium]